MARFSYRKEGNLAVLFDKFFKRANDLFVEREDTILIELNERILALTPVWEGEALINWRWSTLAPNPEYVAPIESPDDPGHTNKMPLGVEPRRAANELRPRQSLMGALRAKEPIDIYLTNNSPHIVDLEYGLLPTVARSRVQAGQGIVRLAIKEVMGNLY